MRLWHPSTSCVRKAVPREEPVGWRKGLKVIVNAALSIISEA